MNLKLSVTLCGAITRFSLTADKLHTMKIKKNSENETAVKIDPNKKFTQ